MRENVKCCVIKKSLVMSFSLIRAGQCITDIYRVIEELVSNSIDAKARIIHLFFDPENFSVRIEDDGTGMSMDVLRHVGKPNTTTKGNQTSGLLHCTPDTLGFRGEAINAISYMGRVCIETRHRAMNPSGSGTFKKIVSNGETMACFQCDSDRSFFGTTVEVFDLFSQTPVRHKLLVDGSEAHFKAIFSKTQRLLSSYALSNPCLSIDFSMGVHKWCYNSEPSTRSAFAQLCGPTLAMHLIETQVARDEFRIHSLLSDDVQKSASCRYLFVNGRPMNGLRRVEEAITHIYRTVFSKLDDRNSMTLNTLFPSYVLFIWCDPSCYDILRDPAKSMVEFRNWATLLECVESLVRSVLPVIPLGLHKSVTGITEKKKQKRKRYISFGKNPGCESTCCGDLWKKSKPNQKVETIDKFAKSSVAASKMNISREFLANAEVLCQIGNKFIIVKHESELLCVDQHAAHERVRLERFEDDLNNQREAMIDTFILETPCKLCISGAQRHVLETHGEFFCSWGYAWVLVDPFLIEVRSVPVLFRLHLEPVSLLEIVEVFLTVSTTWTLRQVPIPIRKLMTQRACRGAIKFGDTLSLEECCSLVQDLANCRLPFQCAHGRPSVVPLARLPKTINM